MNNEQKLLGIFSEILEVEESSLTLNTARESMDDWDSLATVQLIAEIEEAFGCKIPFDEVEKIKTIGDFLSFI